MLDAQKIIDEIGSYSKDELKSNLLIMCSEYLKLEAICEYAKRQTSLITSRIIAEIAPYLLDDDKPECIYAIKPELYEEEKYVACSD